MPRPRTLALACAAAALGTAVVALVPGTAGTPNGQLDTGAATGRLALAAAPPTTLPAPRTPREVGGVLTGLDLDDAGLLTVHGRTSVDDRPADVPLQLWIDRTPAEQVLIAPPVPSTPATTGQPDPPGEFQARIQLTEGPQRVCAIASNDAGPDAVLGCEDVLYRAPLVDGRMIVADYGSGATPRLGIAGEGTPPEAAARVAARAAEWEELTGIPTIPAFDYIQTVAQASPGADGDFSAHTSREDLDAYLAAIREVGGLLILDFQPGGGRFINQVKQYEDYLRHPDVGLALDTEWRMPWGVAPATIIGYADASEINEVGEYLAAIVTEDQLPQKPFVIHQFTRRMVRNRDAIVHRPELATIFHIDGHGTRQLKRGVYQQLLPSEEFYTGFKLFFDEDTGLMTPVEVVEDLARVPAMVSYQ